MLTAAAGHDPATGAVALFAVNRDRGTPLELTVDLRAHRVLAGADPLELTGRVEDRRLTVTLPPVSWNVLELITEIE